jgi:hypothetical protein
MKISSGRDCVALMRRLWSRARASTSAGDVESTAFRHVDIRLLEEVV